MFEKTIDSKETYTDGNDYELVDLGQSIFNDEQIFSRVPFSVYRVNENMAMRPDLLSISAYGEDANTEMLLKYNNIQNPFTIDVDDVIIVPSMMYIDQHVSIQTDEQKNNSDSLIRNYHKYVDGNKLPNTVGSETNTASVAKTTTSTSLSSTVSSTYKEANLAPLGSTPVTEIDGKLYFGTDSAMKCAKDGVSTADYLKAVIKNSIKSNG